MDTAPPLRVVLHDRGAMAVLATVFASTTASVDPGDGPRQARLRHDRRGARPRAPRSGRVPARLRARAGHGFGGRPLRPAPHRRPRAQRRVPVRPRPGLVRHDRPDVAGPPIYGIVVVFGVGRAFVAPAARAMPADVVDPGRLPAARRPQLGLVAGGADRRTRRRRLPLRRLAGVAVPGRLAPWSSWRSSPSASCGSGRAGPGPDRRRRTPRAAVAPRSLRGPALHPPHPDPARRHLARPVRRALRRRGRPPAGDRRGPPRRRRRGAGLAARRRRHRRRPDGRRPGPASAAPPRGRRPC